MPTVLLYVRHAEVFNPEELLYGRLPRFGISDIGRYFAERAADFLQAEPVAAFYTSPLLRARQTTRILARKHPGVPIHVRSQLAETRTSWQGTAFHALPPGKTVYETRQQPTDETIEDIWRRMKALADALLREHDGQTVVCVSHGDPIKILTLGMKGQTLDADAVRQPDPARCSVTRFTFSTPDAAPTITYTDTAAVPRYRRVAALASLAPGSLTRVDFDRGAILLARLPTGEVHAIANRCPHMRAHLHEGVLDGAILTCPLHGSQFNVTDGKVERGPQCGVSWTANYGEAGKPLTPIDDVRPLGVHEVRIEGDDVLIRVK